MIAVAHLLARHSLVALVASNPHQSRAGRPACLILILVLLLLLVAHRSSRC
jgi:hypothetical protein